MALVEHRHGELLLGGVAILLIGAGAVVVRGGPPLRVPVEQPVPPELLAPRRVHQVTRDLPTAIAGPRFVVGDSLAWAWGAEPRVYAPKQGTSAEVRAAVLRLPRSGPVQELIVWLGSDEVRTGHAPETLLEDVAAVIEHVQPLAYVVVAPLPSWADRSSVVIHQELTQALMRRFPGRVVNPYGVLRAALFMRAPVYYDEFRLTAAGYDHVENQVEIALGYNHRQLSFAHGMEQYGPMTTPMPAGLADAPQRGPW